MCHFYKILIIYILGTALIPAKQETKTETTSMGGNEKSISEANKKGSDSHEVEKVC